MRLTCPNCDAHYEVPSEVMPPAGRDVQCSNCGQTWFQHHPDHAPREQSVAPTPPPDVRRVDEEVAPPPPPRPAAPSPAPPSPAPQPKAPPRRELDPAVADILKQEAEAEAHARRQRQQEPLESQPELGLEQTPRRVPTQPDVTDATTEQARARMARMRGQPDPTAEAAATAAAISSRRELLPDIDEINSSLRKGDGYAVPDAEARAELGAGGAPKKAGGFRRGMLTMMFLFAVLWGIYAYAPEISAAVPAIAGTLDSYVVWVDGLRVGLDAQIKVLLSWLDMVATQSAS